ncbi:hypothetical protein TSMEX_008280 [Taenia solium]|eukprot:TsM_000183300 transcript=TsM_000183300 gene=TsM_000183300
MDERMAEEADEPMDRCFSKEMNIKTNAPLTNLEAHVCRKFVCSKALKTTTGMQCSGLEKTSGSICKIDEDLKNLHITSHAEADCVNDVWRIICLFAVSSGSGAT